MGLPDRQALGEAAGIIIEGDNNIKTIIQTVSKSSHRFDTTIHHTKTLVPDHAIMIVFMMTCMYRCDVVKYKLYVVRSCPE